MRETTVNGMTEVIHADIGSPEMIVRVEKSKVFVLGVVFVLTLACNIVGSDPQTMAGRRVTRTPLPTLTPTVAATSAILPQETNTMDAVVMPMEDVAATSETDPIPVVATATLPSPVAANPEQTNVDAPADNPPNPEPTSAQAGVSGWSFANVRAYSDPYGDGLLVYGDMVNGTGSVQELVAVTGTFFDAQGQVAASADNIVDYWPFDIVPVGGQLPFELTVLDIQQAADFDLIVDSQPSDQAPHQNFNVSNVESWSDEGVYCLVGELENRGDFLNEYVVIVAVLFDNQNQMLGFGEYYEPEPEEGLTEFPLEFDICIDVGDQNVARYELRAWGQ